MKLALVPLVLCLLAPASPAPAPVGPSADEDAPFVLGVLRRDGLVFPFASFTGKEWQVRWPDELRWTQLPLTLDDVPDRWWGKPGRPSEMTIWSEGKARGTLRLGRPVVVMPACDRRIAITSDYRPTELPPPPAVRPYPKDGLVVSGSQPIDAIPTVPRSSPDWAAVAQVLIDPVDDAEQLAINAFTAWQHPVKRRERRQVPVELEALYRVPMDAEGWTAYHVEAVKRYAPGPDDEGCGLVTSVSGWVALGPKGKQWTRVFARVTYCDRKGVSYFLPLGTVKVRGRTHWVFQASGYENESYSIVYLDPKSVESGLLYVVGSCRGF